ncbi:glycine betaine ABC transporter substrate-binding protein [Spirochaetota bacterium]
MKTELIKRVSKLMLLLLIVFFFNSCGRKTDITIGTKNFTEQIILGEIMAELIANQLGLKVKKRFNLGGTFICFNALKQGEIDLYPEYTGTGLTAILKKPVINDNMKVYEIVKKNFKENYGLLWLKPFGFNNTYTITMRKSQAGKLHLTKISDLKKHMGKLRTGFTSEFFEREDGLKGLKKAYELSFKIKPKELDPGLMYKAIKENEVDVICGFATDGRIPAYDLQILQDDKHFFPPYYAAPVLRDNVLKKHPALEPILNKLYNLISDLEMSRMNYNVDQEGRKASDVANEFLHKHKLLKGE